VKALGCLVDAWRAVVVERMAARGTRVCRMLRVKRRGAREAILIMM